MRSRSRDRRNGAGGWDGAGHAPAAGAAGAVLVGLMFLLIVGLAVYHAAFVCEALRSGVNTVPVGQAEAARSIGLGFGQSLRHVVLPQAFRGAVAPLASVLIALIKNTTVASIIRPSPRRWS